MISLSSHFAMNLDSVEILNSVTRTLLINFLKKIIKCRSTPYLHIYTLVWWTFKRFFPAYFSCVSHFVDVDEIRTHRFDQLDCEYFVF